MSKSGYKQMTGLPFFLALCCCLIYSAHARSINFLRGEDSDASGLTPFSIDASVARRHTLEKILTDLDRKLRNSYEDDGRNSDTSYRDRTPYSDQLELDDDPSPFSDSAADTSREDMLISSYPFSPAASSSSSSSSSSLSPSLSSSSAADASSLTPVSSLSSSVAVSSAMEPPSASRRAAARRRSSGASIIDRTSWKVDRKRKARPCFWNVVSCYGK